MSAKKEKKMLSENTANMKANEIEEMQKNIAEMTVEELKTFRNGFDPDTMGFNGEEC